MLNRTLKLINFSKFSQRLAQEILFARDYRTPYLRVLFAVSGDNQYRERARHFEKQYQAQYAGISNDVSVYAAALSILQIAELSMSQFICGLFLNDDTALIASSDEEVANVSTEPSWANTLAFVPVDVEELTAIIKEYQAAHQKIEDLCEKQQQLGSQVALEQLTAEEDRLQYAIGALKLANAGLPRMRVFSNELQQATGHPTAQSWAVGKNLQSVPQVVGVATKYCRRFDFVEHFTASLLQSNGQRVILKAQQLNSNSALVCGRPFGEDLNMKTIQRKATLGSGQRRVMEYLSHILFEPNWSFSDTSWTQSLKRRLSGHSLPTRQFVPIRRATLLRCNNVLFLHSLWVEYVDGVDGRIDILKMADNVKIPFTHLVDESPAIDKSLPNCPSVVTEFGRLDFSGREQAMFSQGFSLFAKPSCATLQHATESGKSALQKLILPAEAVMACDNTLKVFADYPLSTNFGLLRLGVESKTSEAGSGYLITFSPEHYPDNVFWVLPGDGHNQELIKEHLEQLHFPKLLS